MGRVNHYEAYVLYERDGYRAQDIAELYDSEVQTIYAIVHREAWDRRHLPDRFMKLVKDKMFDLYEDAFRLDYRNGTHKLYRVLCRYFKLSIEGGDDEALLDCISKLKPEDLKHIPGISDSYARVVTQMINDIHEGVLTCD